MIIHRNKIYYLTFAIFFTCNELYGYLGPGMVSGFIMSILSILATIIFFLWGVIYFPLKRFLNKLKEKYFRRF